MNFVQSLRIGKLGESQIANWLRAKHGLHILPAYEKQIGEYKGPTLYCAEGDTLILPDLLAFQGPKFIWFEAKNKSTFTWHRNTKNWQTGIDVRLYDQYLEVQKRTQIPVWLLFLQQANGDTVLGERSPAGLYGQKLDILRTKEDHRGSFLDGTQMVFWNKAALLCLASLEEVAACQLAP
jgi:hypothetical protein